MRRVLGRFAGLPLLVVIVGVLVALSVPRFIEASNRAKTAEPPLPSKKNYLGIDTRISENYFLIKQICFM
jgi:hypothetical protein